MKSKVTASSGSRSARRAHRARKVALFSALFALTPPTNALAAPATPVPVWRTAQRHTGAPTNALTAVTGTLLVDGSFLIAYLGPSGLMLTRLDAAGALLSSFTVDAAFDNSSYSTNSEVIAAAPTGEVFAASGVGYGRGSVVTRWDAYTGRSLWKGALPVDEIAPPEQLAVDPAGHLVMAGASRYNAGIVVMKLDRFSGQKLMGPILLGQEYGNFGAMCLDTAGNPVITGLIQTTGATNAFAVGKISGLTGLEIWGATGVGTPGETRILALRSSQDGDVLLLGGASAASLWRFAGSTGAIASGPIVVSGANTESGDVGVDGSGDAYVAAQGGYLSLDVSRVSRSGDVVWTATSPLIETANMKIRVVVDGGGNATVLASTGYFGLASHLRAARFAHGSGALLAAPRDLSPALSMRTGTVVLDPGGDLLAAGDSDSGFAAARFAAADQATLWGPVPIGGTGGSNDSWTSVAVDGSGDVLLAGTVLRPDGTTAAAVQKQSGVDGHVLWGPVLLDQSDALSPKIALDASGNAFVCQPGAHRLCKLAGADGGTLWGPVTLTDSFAAMSADAAADLVLVQSVVVGSSWGYDYAVSVSKYSGVSGTLLWGPIQWQAGLSEVASILRLDAAGNAFVAGTHHATTSSGWDGFVVAFSGADGSLLGTPRIYTDFTDAVGRVLLDPVPGGGFFFTTLYGSGSWSGYPVAIRRLDASGAVSWGPVAPVLPAPSGWNVGGWVQAVTPSGDLLVNFVSNSWPSSMVSARIRVTDGAVQWSASNPLPNADTRWAACDADGNLTFAYWSSTYSALGRVSGTDGSPVWSTLTNTSPYSVPTINGVALRGRDVILAGSSGGGAAIATRLTGDLAIVPTVDGDLVAACGEAFSYALTAVNGREPYFWSVVSGALPPGLTLSSGGAIAGSASGQGLYAVRVKVQDADGRSAERDLSLEVVDAEGLVTIAATPSSFCQYGSTTLSVPGTWTSYEWLPGHESTATIVVSPSQPTTYGVLLTNANGCVRHGSIAVTPQPGTAPPVLTAPATATADSVGYVASVPAHEGSAYAWTISGGTITGGQGTSRITFTTGPAGTLSLGVTESLPGACSSDPAHANVSVRALAATTGFYTVAPCRVLDTRGLDAVYGGPGLASGTPRVLTVGGTCGVPADARAIAANVTSIAPAAAGELHVGPADVATAQVPSIPLTAGRVRATSAVLALDASGRLAFLHDTTATVDVILDVSGYFK